MIVYSAFMPHSPLLLESIGGEHRKKLKKTIAAVEKIHASLVEAAVDTVVIFSAHPTQHADAFSINLQDPFTTDLSKFGDHGTGREFHPDLRLIDTLQRSLRKQSIPVTLDTDHALDHGATVPLLLLFPTTAPSPKIIPVTFSNLDPKNHAAFGRALHDVLEASNKRIAVIATGDLSHCLSKKSPLGMRAEGKEFDAAIQHAISSLSLSQLLSLDPKLVEQASECSYRPLLMLFGLLEQPNVTPRLLAYEAPFGVGFLTADFSLT